MKEATVGLAITAAVTGALWVVWGVDVVPAGLVFGLGATAIHVTAAALLRSALDGELGRLMARWAMGMGLRLVGVVAFAVAVMTMEERFPAVPTAIAFLGVMMPLMGMEMHTLRKRLG